MMYNLKQLSLITGLTERTLRNYLKQGILVGEKTNGVWGFSDEEVGTFLENDTVKSAMKLHRNTLIYDFLNDKFNPKDTACVVLHLPNDDPMRVAQFFCNAVNERTGLQMRFDALRGLNQVTLVGDMETVREILNAYRS